MDKIFRRNRPLTNPESIAAIPERFITSAQRSVYRRRALADEDVYAYQAANSTVETWNIWDTDTQIVLPLLTKVWQIRAATFQGNGLWHVILQRRDEDRDIRLTIEMHAQHDQGDTVFGPRYKARAQRRILDVVNHCAHHDIDPQQLEGTFH